MWAHGVNGVETVKQSQQNSIPTDSLQKTVKVNPLKQLYLYHLKIRFRLGYKSACNTYSYAHFNTAEAGTPCASFPHKKQNGYQI